VNRILASLAIAGAVCLVVTACDPSDTSSTPVPTTTSTAPVTTSEMSDQQANQQVEEGLRALGFKPVPNTEVPIMGGLNLSIRLDLGCAVADGVGFYVDGGMKPTGVTVTTTHSTTADDSSQSVVNNTYQFKTQPTTEQIQKDQLCK